MKIIIPALTAILIMATTSAGATTCADLEKSVDWSTKLIASEISEGIGDDSAPRATLKEIRISNEWKKIDISINLMAQNKCSPLAYTPNPANYLTAALNCSMARTKGENDTIVCNKQEWNSIKK